MTARRPYRPFLEPFDSHNSSHPSSSKQYEKLRSALFLITNDERKVDEVTNAQSLDSKKKKKKKKVRRRKKKTNGRIFWSNFSEILQRRSLNCKHVLTEGKHRMGSLRVSSLSKPTSYLCIASGTHCLSRTFS